MKQTDFDSFDEVVEQYNITLQSAPDLEKDYSGYVTFTIIIAFIFFAISFIILYISIIDYNSTSTYNYWYLASAILTIFDGLFFLFISAIFYLLNQIKEFAKIILFKMGDHIIPTPEDNN